MVRMGVGRGGHQRKGRSTQPLTATRWDWGRGKRATCQSHGVGGGSSSGFSPSGALQVTVGSIPYWLCDMGQVLLCLSFLLFKMEILMAATLKGSCEDKIRTSK